MLLTLLLLLLLYGNAYSDWLWGSLSTEGRDAGRLLELLADRVLGELLPLVPARQVAAWFKLDGAVEDDKVGGRAVAGLDVRLGDIDSGETESVSWEELGGD